jgi:hypothetical protein
MRFFLPFPLSHTLKNLPSRFRGPHPTFKPFLFNFKMGGLEPPKYLLLVTDSPWLAGPWLCMPRRPSPPSGLPQLSICACCSTFCAASSSTFARKARTSSRDSSWDACKPPNCFCKASRSCSHTRFDPSPNLCSNRPRNYLISVVVVATSDTRHLHTRQVLNGLVN